MSKIKSLMIFLLVIFSCTFWAATSFADNVVVKQWTEQLGTNSIDYSNGVAVDSDGNAYVTGYTFGSLDGNTSAGSSDIFLTKYNSSGVKQWTKQWGTGGDDKGYGVAIDTAGNAYVTGYTFGSLDGNTNSGYRDIFLTKYNSSGVKQWTKQWGTMETISMEYCGGVAVDSSGNAYVTGCTGGSIDGNTNAGGTDIFLIKYNSSGVKQWTKQWGTSTSDEGNGVSVDSSGNAYVAGSTVGSLDGNTSAGNTDIFLTKFILRSNTGPVLLFTDEIGYQTDGVNPSNGSPSTQFTYRVLYTDADSDTPKAGYPKVYIKNNETNISGSPFTMSYVSGVNNTGAIYYFTTTLPSLSSNYSYYFEAYDIFSATATGIATQISTGPIIFSSCTILWTGEVGFENDGVNPSSGAPSGIFTYRINYINLNNDVPYSGYPKLYIKKGGTNISGSPFVLSEYNPLDTNYTDGKIYFTTVTLNATGRDYTYYFEAKDTFGIFANGAGNTETLGPYVNTPPNTSNKQPSNGVTYTRTTKNPSFSWTYSDIDQNTQSSYQLQLRTADGTYGDTNSKDTGEITSSQNSYTPTNFNLIIGKYYWRVCTKDNSGFSNAQGAYSAETSFSLDNSSPTLSWTNEDGYKQGGLNINKDNLKEYIFRVKYTDVDNDAPKTGYPKLHLKLNNTEVAGSPFTMQEVDTLNTNFIDGKIYSYTIANLVGADNYSYYFEASDIYDGSALGIACTQTSQLAIMTKPPELKSAKVYHGIFKPGNSEECYVSFNAEQQGNYTVKVYDTSGAMIRELYNGTASPGLTTIKWNGKDDSGNMVSSGVYLIHIKGVDVDVRKKVGVIR